MTSTLSNIFSTSGSASSSNVITIPHLNLRISHGELPKLVRELQTQLLSLGLGKGDVISASLINGLELVLTFLATGGIRAVSAPLNPQYTQAEVEFYLKDTTSSLLVVPPAGFFKPGSLDQKGLDHAIAAAKKLKVKIATLTLDGKTGAPKLKVVYDVYNASKGIIDGKDGKMFPQESGNGKDPKEGDVALVLHTSGTTGKPKAVPLSHLNLFTSFRNIIKTYNLSPKDRGYLVMPLFHVHGLMCGLLAPILSGGSVVIPTRFDKSRFWDDFAKEKCNWYTAVPTMHSILLSSPIPNSLPSIRFIRSCSSSLAPATFEQLQQTFKAPVLEAYAMTEAAHQMTSNPLPENGQHGPGSVGPGQGVEVSIRSEDGMALKTGERGEVCIRGANVTKGYVNNPKANKENFFAEGWFRTGDQGILDERGYLALTGRLKELINRGGEKISPLEIDSALLSLSGVGEAVCFGVPDDKYGEVVWAALVPKGSAKLETKQIQKDLEAKLAKFKIPVRIFVVESIPKTATGKIQRRHVSTAFVERAKKEDAKGDKRASKL